MYWSLGLVLLLSSVVASRGPEDLTADIFIQKLSRWTKKTAAWTEDLTLFSFGFSGPLNYPLISTESSTHLDSPSLFKTLSKPNAVIITGESVNNLPKTKATLKDLEKQIRQIPSFILVLNDRINNIKDLDGIQFESEAPWVLAEEGEPILTLFCPNTSIVRKMVWTHNDFSDWRNFKSICSENKKHLRVAFNGAMPFVDTNLNVDSIEGVYIKTFIEKYGLSIEWNDAGWSWGPYNTETGVFGGVVGLVGYDTSDVGTASMSYKEARILFVDYSPAVGEDGSVWWSKLPQKLPPATNLIRTFDATSWAMTGLAMLTVSLFLMLVSYLGSHYGVGTRDYVDVLIVPFRMLNAEAFPNWFDQNLQHPSRQKFFMPGFTGSSILLLWSLMGSVIAMAFLSNIRNMLLSPVLEKPVDSTKDLILTGKIPINAYKLGFWPSYLQTSPNEWERKAYDIGEPYEEKSMRDVLLQTVVYADGTHSLLTTYEFIAYEILSNPWYKDKTPPYYHISKEILRPYYHGWICNRVSKWKDDLDMHILLLQQAGMDLRNRRTIFAKLLSAKQVSGDLEVIKLEFLLFAYLLLGFGTLISIVAFGFELLLFKLKSKSG